MKKCVKKLVTFLAGIVFFIGFPIFAFLTPLKIRYYEVKSQKLSAKIRVVLITDLHSSIFKNNQRELIDAIKDAKPDVIAMSGDIFDDVTKDRGALLLFDGIKDLCPIYFVRGNHEFWSKRPDEMIDILNGYGVTSLKGDMSAVEINGQNVVFLGVDDPDVGKVKFYEDLDRLGSQDTGGYKILLAHRPELIYEYLKYDFDLILCGHAHGGQFRFPPFINGIFSPNQGFFPKYAGGRYDFDSATMIVSRGLSKESFIPRIFNPFEVCVIDIGGYGE